MTADRPDDDPVDRTTGHDPDAGVPQQDRRRLVDLTRVEAGEPERRAPFKRFVEDDPDT